ncbi:MAG: ABC transporter substrate-binding protein [Eubacteriales bacterium]
MKKLISILIAIATLMALVSCAEGADGGKFYSFTDSTGRKIGLDSRPEKVAVLFSSYAEMWTLAGGEVSVTVGESVERGFADESAVLVDSGAGKTIDREILLSSGADFIIASADIAAQAELGEWLDGLGIPCALFRVDSFADYAAAMYHLCAITGRDDLYEKNVVTVEAEIEQILASVDRTKQPKILFVRCGSSYDSTKAKNSSENFVCRMLFELGAINIADAAPILCDGMALEAIIDADPEKILFSVMGNEEKSKAYMNSELASAPWQAVSAVRDGNYVYLERELFQFKPNARWADAYKFLAEYLYGEG